jgi:glycosyltransferase involved in cell wall biosynthesis
MTPFPKPDIISFPLSQPNAANKFSIVIPSWNNLEMLQLCVQSILKNSRFKHQIIVHLNEGTDGSLEWVKSQNLDHTCSAQNAGICYAVNAMANLAHTEYILFLNDDMYVCPDWDLHLMNEVTTTTNPLWYFSGTMIEPHPSSNKCNLAPFDFGTNVKNFKEQELLEFCKTTHRKDWNGGSWPPSLVTKELFFKVGGYSVEFSPGMYSDPDFSMKLWQAGVRNFKGIAASMVYHFQSKSTGRVEKNDGRKQFAMKWGIPASFFYKHVLEMGKDHMLNRPLNFDKNISYLMAKMRAAKIAKE